MSFRDEFSALLNMTIVKGDVSDKEYSALVNPIHNLINKNIPSKLFRYRVCDEKNFDALAKDAIWAVSASMFNDPYDSLFYINQELLFNEVKKYISIESISDLWKYVHKNKKLPADQNAILGKKASKKLVDNILKVQLSLFQKILGQKPLSDDNLRSELKNKWLEIRDRAQKLNKIACFSEDLYSTTMWSHYADYHKGFVLEYDLREGNGLNCDNCQNRTQCQERKTANLFPVIYNNNRYDATDYVRMSLFQELLMSQQIDYQFILPDSLFYQKMFLHKATMWDYEKEWRLLCCSKDVLNKDVLPIAMKRPVAIYYGTRISSINKKILHSIAQERKIREYQMKMDDTSPSYNILETEIS